MSQYGPQHHSMSGEDAVKGAIADLLLVSPFPKRTSPLPSWSFFAPIGRRFRAEP